MSKSNLYKDLIDFNLGRIENTDLENYDYIRSVKKNGIVSLEFNLDEYFSILINEENNDYYYLVDSFYNRNTNLIGFERTLDDWLEGYILERLNDENIELVINLMKILGRFNGSYNYGYFSKILYEKFKNKISDFLYFHSDMEDIAMMEVIKEFAIDNYCQIFNNYGLMNGGNINSCFRKYYTTVQKLVSLYETTGKYDYSLEKLLRYISKTENLAEDDLYDIAWGNYWKKIDNESINEYFEEKMKDIIQEVEENHENIEKFKKIEDRLKKFDYGVWYNLPKDETKMFKINFISIETLQINFDYKIKGVPKISKDQNLSFKNFLLFLYHPELF